MTGDKPIVSTAPMLGSVSVGQFILAARLRQGLGVDELVRLTHISSKHIRALEENNYDAFRSSTFARGYLRQYALYVNIDEHELLAAYDEWHHEQERAYAEMDAPLPDSWWDARKSAMAIAASVGVAVTLSWFYSVQDRIHSDKPEEYTAPSSTATTEQLGVLANSLLGSIESSDDIAQEKVANGSVEPLSAERAGLTASASDSDRLSVEVLGDSWLVVNDGDGRELYRDLARAGNAMELAGRSPFSVMMGYAPGVRLTVNGEPFAIEAIRRDNTARVLVEPR